MKTIVLTGGGTAGHVTPNLALLPALTQRGFSAVYIGSYTGIEKELAENAGLPYYGISSGKLRRYFSLRNFTDPFRVIKGFAEAKSLLKKIRPSVVFSKGGFVSVPVVRAAASLGIPVVIHESDMTPGLANKLSYGAASKICCNFPETVKHLPAEKAVLTGSPIREELFKGDRAKALAFTGLSGEKPVLLIVGGSLGAGPVNDVVRAALPRLLAQFDLVHLCGRGKTDESLADTPGYRQYEYISEEMADLFALADLVISRAGANAICEIRALAIPNVLIPLSAAASRGDQILNANSFAERGFSFVLPEEEANEKTLCEAVQTVWSDRDRYIAAMRAAEENNAVTIITDLLASLS